MRALITGVTGFIGSHVAELLVAHGCPVFGVARSGRWHSDSQPPWADGCQLHAWDIADRTPTSLATQIHAFAPDVVFHFAGMSIPAKCGKSKPTALAKATNVDGTHRVLDLVAELSPQPKFIFASSLHVYAQVQPEAPYVTEQSPLAPVSAYGKTKRDCELEITQRVESDGLNACIARGFHHIGPRQPEGLMLTDWLGQLSQPDCVDITVKSTNSYLDLVDVRDAAIAYKLLAESEGAQGVFNLGSGVIAKSGDVLQTILNRLNKTVRVVEASPREQWNAIADITKLRAMGWDPKLTYRDTIAAMIGPAATK